MTPPPPEPHPERAAFLAHLLRLMGVPYIYGGRNTNGVDCWGLIALAYKEAGGSVRLIAWWTDVAWNTLGKLDSEAELQPGDLAFYGGAGPKDVAHVMVCLSNGLVMGASGGDSTTKTIPEALRVGAKVKVFESLTAYNKQRGDFRGFRRLAFRGE